MTLEIEVRSSGPRAGECWRDDGGAHVRIRERGPVGTWFRRPGARMDSRWHNKDFDDVFRRCAEHATETT